MFEYFEILVRTHYFFLAAVLHQIMINWAYADSWCLDSRILAGDIVMLMQFQ